jgi:hypothetical protein
MSKNSSSTSQHISAFSATQGMQSAMHEILPTRSDVAPTVPQRDHTAFTMLQTSMRDQLQSRPEQSAAKLNSRPGISNSPSINTCQQRMLQLPTDLPIPGQFQSPMGTRQLLDPYVASISASEADNSTSGGPRSLYVGKLHLRVNEGMLLELFSALGSVLEVKIIRDKLTSQSCGYGFVTFFDSRWFLTLKRNSVLDCCSGPSAICNSQCFNLKCISLWLINTSTLGRGVCWRVHHFDDMIQSLYIELYMWLVALRLHANVANLLCYLFSIVSR